MANHPIYVAPTRARRFADDQLTHAMLSRQFAARPDIETPLGYAQAAAASRAAANEAAADDDIFDGGSSRSEILALARQRDTLFSQRDSRSRSRSPLLEKGKGKDKGQGKYNCKGKGDMERRQEEWTHLAADAHSDLDAALNRAFQKGLYKGCNSHLSRIWCDHSFPCRMWCDHSM